MIASTVSVGIPYAEKIFFILPRCIESNALAKSTNNSVAGVFFDLTPSIIRRIVNICPVVDLFWRKPF